jgi:hypothetical protein
MYRQAKFATIFAPPIVLRGQPKEHENISKKVAGVTYQS